MGDIVSFARDANQKEGERGRQWSVGSRIVGFEGDNVWLNCMGIPILASAKKIRPCTPEELLAFLLNQSAQEQSFQGGDKQQSKFLDLRQSADTVQAPEKRPDVQVVFSDNREALSLRLVDPVKQLRVIAYTDDNQIVEDVIAYQDINNPLPYIKEVTKNLHFQWDQIKRIEILDSKDKLQEDATSTSRNEAKNGRGHQIRQCGHHRHRQYKD